MPGRAHLRPIVRCVSPARGADDNQGLATFARVPDEDWLAVEAPLELRVSGDPFITTMRTPGHDRDLLLGWLYHEGLLRTPGDVSSLAPCAAVDAHSQGVVYELVPAPTMQQRLRDRDLALTHRTLHTSCGICGRQTIDDLITHSPTLGHGGNWPVATIHALLSRCNSRQPLFHQTGCTHGASIGRANGEIVATREDVGRHNAVDKLTGWLFRTGQLPVDAECALVVSSRASLEIVHKALVAGFSAVFSLSAPTSLAVDLAARSGILLAGFFRADKFNVYTEHTRVTEGGA